MCNRFKPGDLVRCIQSSFGQAYVLGEIYKVREVYDSGRCISTIYDSKGSTTNGFMSKYFVLYKELDSIEKEINDLETMGWRSQS